MKTFFAGAGMALLAISSLHAQSNGNGVGDFTIERILALTGVISPYTPNLPDAVLAGVQSGALELHQRFVYNSAERTMEQFAFVVPGNSPLPFPDLKSATIADHYLIQIESTGVSPLPAPSVILSGHAISNDPPTPFGNITGAGVTLAFGYHGSGSSVQYGPIMEAVSPLYNLYSPTGAGALSLNPSPHKCSNATLNGTYMFQLAGSVQSGNAFMPYAQSGRFVADGAGNITVLDSGDLGGQAFSGRAYPISYALDANCGGALTFGGSVIDIEVSRDGTSLNMVSTKPGFVIANGTGRLQ
jgi:hypothetical protein